MAATAPDNLYLSPDQQDLLLAALTSNSSSSPMFNTPPLSQHISHSVSKAHHSPQRSFDAGNNMAQDTPPPPSAGLTDGFPGSGTPLLGGDMEFGDWDIDGDGSWDYDFPPGDMMHDSPASNSNSNDGTETANGDTPRRTKSDGEKRKEHPDGDKSLDPHDSEPKRRDDKGTTAKKPGRKPLTSEPTSKRKAQNRAAQRAFRERKEKHLKDLEQKVQDLENASESANHENSILRAQVDRLQTELREYRRRLQTAELTRATSLGIGNHPGFQFDFPPFGSGLFGRQDSLSKDKDAQKNGVVENKRSSSTGGLSNNSSNYTAGFDSASVNSTPKLNGGRDSTSSPSASSVSQHGPGSSCGTSPEPMSNSPTMPKPHDSLKSISEEKTSITTSPNGDQYVFPKAPQFSTASETTANSLDWLAQQSSNSTFDPVFNDYRDPVNDINSNISNINMSFFDDAFTMPSFTDIASPLGNVPQLPPAEQTQAASKKDLMAEIDAINNDDDDEVVPADDDPKQMLSCNKIWDRISSHPRFVSGELDMDGLCSELRSKAKCSEVGVVVAENDVQEVLGKVGMSHKELM